MRGFVVRRVILCLVLGGALGRPAIACEVTSGRDWLDDAPVQAAQPAPAPCAVVQQTPPDFRWPHRAPGTRYTFSLTDARGHVRSVETHHNWLLWPEALAPGEYLWRVVAKEPGAATVLAGQPRRFTVAQAAIPFIVPDWRALYQRALGKPHPRALPDGEERLAWIGALANERKAGVARLLESVDNRARQTLPQEPALKMSYGQIQAEVHDEEVRTQNATLAWLIAKRPAHLHEAKRRALNLARWDSAGATGWKNQDESARSIAWTLTLAYDWLYAQWAPAERELILNAIAGRLDAMVSSGLRERLERVPFDSHGDSTLSRAAAMAAILAGDHPRVQDWFRELVPFYFSEISPWGGEDGGFGNGTAYSLWVAGEAALNWNVLRWITGVDIGQKAWARNFLNYLIYFMPPGAPRARFGDGAEDSASEYWARFIKAYAAAVPSPLGNWYARQFAGDDGARLEILLAPRAKDFIDTPAIDLPASAYFPSIGWVAMYGDVKDRKRMSVYFKSSAYGSHNHSHADQNSFTIDVRGEALAIDSGYYDAYHSPHWENWYKQTLAHNAMTFDGGKGQGHNTLAASGKIVQFEHGKDFTIASGDATAAYMGQVRQAARSLVFIPPGTVLVFDSLESSVPRKWEWNIHALERMRELTSGMVEIQKADARLCLAVTATQTMHFSQHDRFSDAPRGERPAQWHGVFKADMPSKRIDIAAILSTDCAADAPKPQHDGDGWRLEISGQTVTYGAGRAAVRQSGAGPVSQFGNMPGPN